jgi:hypothetical protein
MPGNGRSPEIKESYWNRILNEEKALNFKNNA